MTSLEPSVVTYPLFRTDIYTARARAGWTLTTKATEKVPTSTLLTIATDSPTLLQTSTGIPPLPSAFDSPLATGKIHTPAIAIVFLVVIIIFALFLFVAFCYFFFLRFRGKCPQCPQYESELEKWKNGSLKPTTREMVRNRQDNRDLEKGVDMFDGKAVNPRGDQAKQHKVIQRAQSLASLEGRTPDRYQGNKTKREQALQYLQMAQDRVQREGGLYNTMASIFRPQGPRYPEEEHESFQRLVDWATVAEPAPAHLPPPTARDEVSLANDPAPGEPNFKGTYEEYARDVLAERQRQKVARSIAG